MKNRDALGKVLNIGDRVAYAARDGDFYRMREGLIENIHNADLMITGLSTRLCRRIGDEVVKL